MESVVPWNDDSEPDYLYYFMLISQSEIFFPSNDQLKDFLDL